MWWTSACLGVGHYNSGSLCCTWTDSGAATRGCGIINRGGIMQPFSILRTTVADAREVIN